MLAPASFLLLALFAQDDKPLEKGPIHEAYAQPFEAKPVVGPLLKKKPPEVLKEVPPEDKPEGKDVRWMDGYWQWDDERDDYIWISGFWRQIPPGKEWTPGRFEALNNEWRWIPGYWRDQELGQDEFVEEAPPAIPEIGPSVPAPNPQMIWASGYWVRQGPRWGWRPGVWINYRPGWVWNPGRWAVTAFGFTFVRGYWDYPLEHRGLLFSPVYYPAVVYSRPGFFHRPRFVVCYEDLPCGLFYRRGFGSYYYGDYFRPSYVSIGFTFWSGSRFSGPDPLFAYYRHGNQSHWAHDLEVYRRDRFAGRPAVAPVINNVVINNTTIINNRNTVNNINSNNRQNIATGPGGPGNPERRTNQVRVVEAKNQPKVVLASHHPEPTSKDIPESQVPPKGQGKPRQREGRDVAGNRDNSGGPGDRSRSDGPEKGPMGHRVGASNGSRPGSGPSRSDAGSGNSAQAKDQPGSAGMPTRDRSNGSGPNNGPPGNGSAGRSPNRDNSNRDGSEGRGTRNDQGGPGSGRPDRSSGPRNQPRDRDGQGGPGGSRSGGNNRSADATSASETNPIVPVSTAPRPSATGAPAGTAPKVPPSSTQPGNGNAPGSTPGAAPRNLPSGNFPSGNFPAGNQGVGQGPGAAAGAAPRNFPAGNQPGGVLAGSPSAPRNFPAGSPPAIGPVAGPTAPRNVPAGLPPGTMNPNAPSRNNAGPGSPPAIAQARQGQPIGSGKPPAKTNKQGDDKKGSDQKGGPR